MILYFAAEAAFEGTKPTSYAAGVARGDAVQDTQTIPLRCKSSLGHLAKALYTAGPSGCSVTTFPSPDNNYRLGRQLYIKILQTRFAHNEVRQSLGVCTPGQIHKPVRHVPFDNKPNS